MGIIDWFKSATSWGSNRSTGPAVEAPEESEPAAAPSAPAHTVTPQSVQSLQFGKSASSSGSGVRMPSTTTRKVPGAKTTKRVQVSAAPAVQLPEKDLSFVLFDFSDRVPAGYLREDASPESEVVVSSLDLASDLAKGRACVMLSILAEAAPDLFERAPGPGEDQPVNLPLRKVVEQIGTFDARADQEKADTPDIHYQTPFLKAAIRDGSIIEAPRIKLPDDGESPAEAERETAAAGNGGLPAVAGAPGDKPKPIGRFAAAMTPDVHGRRRPPATVRASVAGGKLKVGGLTTPLIRLGEEMAPPPKAASIPMIGSPLKPPVPPAAVEPPAPPAPVEPPAPPVAVEPPAPPAAVASKPAVPMAPPAAVVPMLSFSLAKLVAGMPASQVDGDDSAIDGDVRADLPMATILPQLATGKVRVRVADFVAAIPERYRRMFVSLDPKSDLVLPLREVLASIPADALQRRPDQVEHESAAQIDTPFSARAREDAERIGGTKPAHGVDPASIAPAPVEPAKASGPAPAEVFPAVAASPSGQRPPMAAFVSRRVTRPAEPTPARPPEPAPVAKAPEPAPPSPAAPGPRTIKFGGIDVSKPAEALPPEPPAPIGAPEAKIEMPAPVVGKAAPPTAEPAPAATGAEAPVVESPVEPAPSLASLENPAAAAAQAELQALFMTEEKLDARKIAVLTTRLPGIKNVLISTGDGLRLAGEISKEFDAEVLCALAPQFFNRTLKFGGEAGLGPVHSCTLQGGKHHLTIAANGWVCVVVEQSERDFLPGIRQRIVQIVRLLAGLYPAPSDSSHH